MKIKVLGTTLLLFAAKGSSKIENCLCFYYPLAQIKGSWLVSAILHFTAVAVIKYDRNLGAVTIASDSRILLKGTLGSK